MSTSKAGEAAQAPNRAALDVLLAKLGRWENPAVETAAGPTYRAMCVAANERAAGASRAAAAKRLADEA